MLIEVEAVPINPSDLGLLFASADTANAQYSPGKVVAKMPENATRAMKARHGMAMPAGNECAGTVIAAIESPAWLELQQRLEQAHIALHYLPHRLDDG